MEAFFSVCLSENNRRNTWVVQMDKFVATRQRDTILKYHR